MGGKALKNIVTRRYDKEEYVIACDVVLNIIHNMLCGYRNPTRFAVIQAYRNKETFGDMDVLIERSSTASTLINQETLKSAFAETNDGFGWECIKNGDVYSFNYKDLQIDLIFNDEKSFSYALNYFAWSDLGNLTGRLAHKFGLKHGHRGLVMPVRNGTHVLGEIEVTMNYMETLQFLDLDVNRFLQGFDELEDMFEWVSKSKYFNPDIYLFENIGSISRIRDKKRPTYNKFLEWCKAYTGEVHEGFSSKMHAQEIVYEHFGSNIKQQYVDLCARGALLNAAKAKFNGELVSTLTGLKEKPLGAFLAYCKNNSMMFEPHNLYMQSQDVLNAEILRLWADYVFEE